MSDSEVKIGRIIKERRNELNISIRELAKRVNVSPSFLSRLEKDERGVTYEVKQSIFDSLDLIDLDGYYVKIEEIPELGGAGVVGVPLITLEMSDKKVYGEISELITLLRFLRKEKRFNIDDNIQIQNLIKKIIE